MSQQIICRQSNQELHLNCSKIDRNLFKVLKLLKDVGMLYTSISNPPSPREVDKAQPQETDKTPQQHQLTASEAIQIIWRSAFLSNNRGVGKQQIKQLSGNILVGLDNQLNEVIVTLGRKIKKIISQRGENSQVDAAKRKILRIGEIKATVQKIWVELNVPSTKHPQNNFAFPLNLFDPSQMNDNQKKLILGCMRKTMLQLDIKVLQRSIVFIQQLETGHCIVTLEQCYPSFMVYKELFKSIIGRQSYNRGLRQLMNAKQKSYQNGIRFDPRCFSMCHKCCKIELKQVTTNQRGHQCHLKARESTLLINPYQYQQKYLYSIYSKANESKMVQSQITDKVLQQHHFSKYVHPYCKVYLIHCERFYCSGCSFQQMIQQKDNTLEKNTPNEKSKASQKSFGEAITEKVKQLQKCLFCQSRCRCQRCTDIIAFNRLMGVFQTVGGNFQEILSEMVFLNLSSLRVYMQLVTFENTDLVKKQGGSNRIELEPSDYENLSYPQQIMKLQSLFFERQRLKQNQDGNQRMEEERSEGESIDSSQIFPNLQMMFEKLMCEERDNDDRQQSKIGTESETHPKND